MPQRQPGKPSKPSSNAISPARREAFAILLELAHREAHADTLLRSPRVSALSPQDRNLCTTLVMGTLRWQIRLDSLIKPLLTKPNARLDTEIRIALRLGALQLLFLDRIPAHAAIGESVALTKAAGHTFASGMVNAVLRKLAGSTHPESIPPPGLSPKELADATAHPAWLVERWVKTYGPEATRAICLHGQRQPELTIRLNPVDLQQQEIELAEQGIVFEPGTLLTAARRVLSGDIASTAAFQSGNIRIQDEGSQLIAELGGDVTQLPKRILDCCAAPGGKTLILAEGNPQAHITACEISSARFEALQARIAASAYASQIDVKLADATQLPDSDRYDLVLVDAPCSGTGTLGRNPEIRHRLQPADLARHHERQCDLLRSALNAAAGRVIYSTCSLEPEENSLVVAEVLAQASDWRQISVAKVFHKLCEDGRITPAGGATLKHAEAADGSMTILPGSLGPETQTDGFFIAILEKKTATSLP
jgi:16S rRNA (cytosine967-C5)-methyltransferase